MSRWGYSILFAKVETLMDFVREWIKLGGEKIFSLADFMQNTLAKTILRSRLQSFRSSSFIQCGIQVGFLVPWRIVSNEQDKYIMTLKRI